MERSSNFFLFSLGKGGGRDIYIYFLTLLMWSPYSSQCVAHMFPIAPQLIPYALPKFSPFSPILVGQGGGTPLSNRNLYFGEALNMCIPIRFLIAPHFYPIMVCPRFNSHVYKLKRWVIMSEFVSILQLAVQRGAFIGECTMFQRNWGWANQYGPFKKKLNMRGHPQSN